MTAEVQARLQQYAEQSLTQWPAPEIGALVRITDGWESELYAFDVA